MKKLLILFGLLIYGVGPAHAGLLDIKGAGKLVADKLGETKALYSISLKGTHGASAYLPVYTLHSKPSASGKVIDYIDAGIGAGIQEGGKGEVFFPVMGDVVALSQRAWRSRWRQDHVSATRLPPIWVGPIFAPPLNKPINQWVIGEVLRIGVSIGLGGE